VYLILAQAVNGIRWHLTSTHRISSILYVHNRNMVKSKTKRDSTRRKKSMTIPEIKTSFDSVEDATYRILREGGTLSEQVKKFQKEWKAIFHRPVRADSAEAYLKIKQDSKKRSNKTRKQRGGMAPLDYATRPGISGNYGAFLEYQTMGSSPTPSGIAMDADCGVKNISPSAASVAAVQKPQFGGTLSDFTHRVLLSSGDKSVPASFKNNFSAALDGQKIASSPVAYQSDLRI